MSHLIAIEDAENDLLSFATRLAEDIKSADGHSEALKHLVPRYIEKGEVDLAAQLADTIADPFNRDRLLTQVAEKCATIDDVEYAFQLAEAIEDSGIAAEARERIAIRQALAGNEEAALETAQTLDHPDNVLQSLALIHDASGNAGKREEALESIEFPTAKAAALIGLAAARLQKEDKKSAVEFLDRASEVAGAIDYETDEIRVFGDVGNLFVEAGRRDRAIETLDKARQVAEKLDTPHREYLLSTVSLGFFHAGSVDLADRVLDQITDKTHVASTLLGFARNYWRANEKDDALEAIDEAYQILKSQHQSETRDSRAKFQLWRSIAAQFAGFGKFERAIEVAQELTDEDEQADALIEIAQIATQFGEDEYADQAYRAIVEDSKRLAALVSMSDAVRESKPEKASEFLESAADMIDSIPQLALRSNALNELAKRFNAQGRSDRARELCHLNIETLRGARDESVRAIAFGDLADVYESMNFELSDEEKEIIRRMIPLG